MSCSAAQYKRRSTCMSETRSGLESDPRSGRMRLSAAASGTVRNARRKLLAWQGVPPDVSNIRNRKPAILQRFLTFFSFKRQLPH